MPGPKKKSAQSKAKPSGPVGTSNGSSKGIVGSFVHEIDRLEGWNVIVASLCSKFDLPDMNSRAGLRKIHANFPAIFERLSKAYDDDLGSEKMMGGIVGIWAKMCIDSILRDKLIERGIIARILPLLDSHATRYVGLEALETVTHHGGREARQRVAREAAPILVRLLETLPDDQKANELILATLTHSVGAAIFNQEHTDLTKYPSLDIPNLLRLVLASIQRPGASLHLLMHAFSFLNCATLQCHREVKAIPALISLFVASLRASDVSIRCEGLMSLLRLYEHESEMDYLGLNPHARFNACQRGFPPHLSELLMRCGPQKSETFLTLECTRDFQFAMNRCGEDHDLYSLGRKIGELITRTEFAVTEGYFHVEGEDGERVLTDRGLPFKMWTESFPFCANALREKKTTSDLDLADIVDLKFLVIRQRTQDADGFARRAIQRNPHIAYFYYVVGLCAEDAKEGLRFCKKGLKAKYTTPFVRQYLLWRSVENAGDLGITILAQSSSIYEDTYHKQGVAFLVSALEDAKSYISEAPPDARQLHAVLNWYILLTFAIKGPELSLNLGELNGTLTKLEQSRQFAEFLGHPFKRTTMRLTREAIMKLYSSASEKFSPTISRLDTLYSQKNEGVEHHGVATCQAEDTLSAWLNEVHIDDHEDHPRIRRNSGRKSDKDPTESVELYRCSWCRNPSVVLKKCSRCSKARYCDASCQKLHWPEHKSVCKA